MTNLKTKSPGGTGGGCYCGRGSSRCCLSCLHSYTGLWGVSRREEDIVGGGGGRGCPPQHGSSHILDQ